MKKLKNFKFSDEVYNKLKWILIIFIPSLELLITTLGGLYNFDTKIINGTISAIATFLGALVGISNNNYNK